MKRTLIKDFAKYVSLNVLGMIGLSCYILADTFFVAKALGARGLAALNLSISIYSVIHGTGLMIGIGGATRFSILRSQKDDRADLIFASCVKLGLIMGVIFAAIGIFGSGALAGLLGADETTLPLTKTYLTTILCFSPFFIMNNIGLAFVRNDNNPRLSMNAMLTGSISNIILDYIFMFPLKLGMFGAAFATGLAPILSLGVLCAHFISKNNRIKYVRHRMKWGIIGEIYSIGLSAFITEVSSAVVLITFNLVILEIEGNIGVAAYGIVANIALVAVSIFTGIAQGIQPLISKSYGLRNYKMLTKVLAYAVATSVMVAAVLYSGLYFNAERVIGIFNSEGLSEVTQIAKTGIEIYFIGFFFAGINIIMTMYLSATEYVREAFFLSIARGYVIIVPLVLVLSRIWRMKGVWLGFLITEAIITLAIVVLGIAKGENRRTLLQDHEMDTKLS